MEQLRSYLNTHKFVFGVSDNMCGNELLAGRSSQSSFLISCVTEVGPNGV